MEDSRQQNQIDEDHLFYHLSDMDLLKYRLKRKGWTDENINEFISKYYGRL